MPSQRVLRDPCLQELARGKPHQTLREGSFLPWSPSQNPSGEVCLGRAPLWLGTGPGQLLAGSSWALAPVDLAPMLHKHTPPPPSPALLPDGRSLRLPPRFRPFPFIFDFFSFPWFLPKRLLSTAPCIPIIIFLFISHSCFDFSTEYSSHSVCLLAPNSSQVEC